MLSSYAPPLAGLRLAPDVKAKSVHAMRQRAREPAKKEVPGIAMAPIRLQGAHVYHGVGFPGLDEIKVSPTLAGRP